MLAKAVFFVSLFGVLSVGQCGEWIRTGPTTISFHGAIDADEFSRFKEIYKSTDETVVLNSSGGRMDAALDIGKVLIQNKKLTAVVNGMCASSCANYLFLAAKTRVISHGTVGFHGNWKAMVNTDSFRTHMAALAPAERTKLETFHNEHVSAETEFLAKAGVSQELFDRTQKENDAGVYEVFLPGPRSFEKYGIHNVRGEQNLSTVARLNVLYENGSDENNAEELKMKLRTEYYGAKEERQNQIRGALKLLNEQFPVKQRANAGSDGSSAR